MGSEWRTAKFSDVCDIWRGGSPRPIHEWIAPQGIPWVKISDATAAGSRYIEQTNEFIRPEGRTKSRKVVPGDLILSNSATPGIPMFMAIDACIHDGWLLLRNFRGIDKLFCYYLLLYERPNIVRQGTGSVFTNLKTEILKDYVVGLPPLPEQRAIAAILGALDDKIELNRRINATLEATARALFKSWFVDFDPVRAKAAGQQPPGLAPHIADLFPDEFVDSELGEIPRGWEVRTIDEFITRHTVGRKYEQKTVASFGIVPVLDQGKSGIIGYHNDDPGVQASLDNPIAVFANHTCYMRLVVFPFSAIQNVIPFTGNGVDTIWAYYATYDKQPFIEYKGHWPDFVINQVPVPPKQLTEMYSHLIRPMISRKRSNEIESEYLLSLRDTLLPKLLSGELRVPDKLIQDSQDSQD